jgi:hypothetical protein
MFDMSFRNISYLRMKYKFEDAWMIFDIVCEGEWEDNPLILYEVNEDEASELVDKGVSIWVLDGVPCVDEEQAIAGAKSQAKYIRKAFEYVRKAYDTLKERGEVNGIRGRVGNIHSHSEDWGEVAEMESNKRNGKGP